MIEQQHPTSSRNPSFSAYQRSTLRCPDDEAMTHPLTSKQMFVDICPSVSYSYPFDRFIGWRRPDSLRRCFPQLRLSLSILSRLRISTSLSLWTSLSNVV